MAPAEYKTVLMAGHNNSSFHSPFLLPCAHILPLFFSPPLEIIQIMRLPPKTNTLLSPHSDHDFVGLFALSMLSNVLKVVYNTRYRIYTDPIPHACATLSSKRTREVRTTHPCRFSPSHRNTFRVHPFSSTAKHSEWKKKCWGQQDQLFSFMCLKLII